MDWLTLQKKVYDITKNENTDDPLYDYELISRYNLDKLEIGMHIKYIKKAYNLNTGVSEDKIYNGGFLIDILNGDKTVNLTLLLKSNIIWKLKFIKFKIYGKSKSKFNNTNKLKNNLREEYKDILQLKMKEVDDILNKEIEIINKNKHKYRVNINNGI